MRTGVGVSRRIPGESRPSIARWITCMQRGAISRRRSVIYPSRAPTHRGWWTICLRRAGAEVLLSDGRVASSSQKRVPLLLRRRAGPTGRGPRRLDSQALPLVGTPEDGEGLSPRPLARVEESSQSAGCATILSANAATEVNEVSRASRSLCLRVTQSIRALFG
jgi:hypothetical protein